MSFLLRSTSTRTWKGGGKSSSAHISRKEPDSMAHATGTADPSHEFYAAVHFLRNEVAAAAAAVAELHSYQAKLDSFQEKGLELVEEAHRALSRLEQALATSTAPELIVVACELRVACQRGLHLFRAHGRYRHFGKLVAMATHGSTVAKYDAVIARLLAILPAEAQLQPATGASAPAGVAAALSKRSGLHRFSSHSGSNSPRQSHGGMDRASTSLSTNTVAAAAGLLERMLRASSGASSTGSWNGSAIPADITGAQTPVAEGLGVLVHSSAHDKITSISFTPPSNGLCAAACVWWAVGDKLEFFSSMTQSTTSFAAGGADRAAVTAITVDSEGNVWCGTAKGSVFVRQRLNWQQVLVDQAFVSRVRVLAADPDGGVVWAGDDSGRLSAFRCHQGTSQVRLECTATILQGKPIGSVLKARSLPSFSTRLRSLSMKRSISCQSSPRFQAAEGPIRAVLVKDERAWVAGGRANPWLTLFNAVSGTPLDTWLCGGYGSCQAMACMLTSAALEEQVALAEPLQHVASSPSRITAGMACPSSATPGSCNAISSVPEDGFAEEPRCSWRLITGHDNGQMLLWGVASDLLQPLLNIGELNCGPVRAIAVLEQQGLVAVARANGDLSLFLRPLYDADWMLQPVPPPSQGLHITNNNTASQQQPYGNDAYSSWLAGGTAEVQQEQHQDSLMTIRPRKLTIRSRKAQVVAAAACAAGVVTASSTGAIKLFSAEALVQEAERGGLLQHAQQHKQRQSFESIRSVSCNCVGSCSSTVGAETPPLLTGDYQQYQQQSPRSSSNPVSNVPNSFYNMSPRQQQSSQGLLLEEGGSVSAAGTSLLSEQHVHQFHSHSGTTTPPWPGNNTLTALSAVVEECEPVTVSEATNSMIRYSSGGMIAAGARAFHVAETSAQTQSSPLPTIPFHLSPAGVGSAGSLSPMTHSGLLAGRSNSNANTAPLPAVAATTLPSSPGFKPTSPMRYGDVMGSAVGAMPEIITAPRAPRAERMATSESGTQHSYISRERRKSERRLSRGSQMQWSTCQVIDSRELRLISSIGSGAYGKVWLAEWMGTQVAVKELVSFQDKAKHEVSKRKASNDQSKAHQRKSEDEQEGSGEGEGDGTEDESDDSIDEEVTRELKALMDEVYMLGSLTHPSVSRFCAVCLDPPMIVMQYYPHGSLFDLLKKGRRGDKRALQELTWAKRLDMLRDVASGMVFLHSRKPPIVHGDLRSPNLLLDLTIDRDRPRYHCKIADFGLARMLGPASSISVSKVTNPRWSAPEVILSSVVSRPADVFSFGVVMWEVLTWQQPYEDMLSVQVLVSVMQQYRPEVPPEEELPGKPGSTLPKYIALMEACWADNESTRPRFEDVVAALDEMRAIDCGKPRSLAGSARASYTETGTPTGGTPTCNTPTGSSQFGAGSSAFGNSPPPSIPNSNPSSAPNSQGTQAALDAATAAAAAAAAAAAGRTPMTSGGSSNADAPETVIIAAKALVLQFPADGASAADDPTATAWQKLGALRGRVDQSAVNTALAAITSSTACAAASNSTTCGSGAAGPFSTWQRLATDSGAAAVPYATGTACTLSNATGDKKLQALVAGSAIATTPVHINSVGSSHLLIQQQQQLFQQCLPTGLTSGGTSSTGASAALSEPSIGVHSQQGGLATAAPLATAAVVQPVVSISHSPAADRSSGTLPAMPTGRTPSRLGLCSRSSTGSPNAAGAAAAAAAAAAGALLLGLNVPPVITGPVQSKSPRHGGLYNIPIGRRPSDQEGPVGGNAAPGSAMAAAQLAPVQSPKSPVQPAVVSPKHKGMSAYSPFAAAAGGGSNVASGKEATVTSVAPPPASLKQRDGLVVDAYWASSPFSAVQPAAPVVIAASAVVGTPTSPGAVPAAAAGACATGGLQQQQPLAPVQPLAVPGVRPSSPFSTVQQPAVEQYHWPKEYTHKPQLQFPGGQAATTGAPPTAVMRARNQLPASMAAVPDSSASEQPQQQQQPAMHDVQHLPLWWPGELPSEPAGSLAARSPCSFVQPSAEGWASSTQGSTAAAAAGVHGPGATQSSSTNVGHGHAAHGPSRLGKSSSSGDSPSAALAAGAADGALPGAGPASEPLNQLQAGPQPLITGGVQQPPVSPRVVARPVSPFAAVSLAEVQGPIVGEQVKAALATGAAHDTPCLTLGWGKQQQPLVKEPTDDADEPPDATAEIGSALAVATDEVGRQQQLKQPSQQDSSLACAGAFGREPAAAHAGMAQCSHPVLLPQCGHTRYAEAEAAGLLRLGTAAPGSILSCSSVPHELNDSHELGAVWGSGPVGSSAAWRSAGDSVLRPLQSILTVSGAEALKSQAVVVCDKLGHIPGHAYERVANEG